MPEKMLQPELAEPVPGFVAAGSLGCHKLVVNRRRRLPLLLVLQQARRVESSLVKPEKFRRSSRFWIEFENSVKGRQGTVSIRFFLETDALFEQGLIAPVGLICRFICELIVQGHRLLQIRSAS